MGTVVLSLHRVWHDTGEICGRKLDPGGAASFRALTRGNAEDEALGAGRPDEAGDHPGTTRHQARNSMLLYSVCCNSLHSVHSCAQKSVE